jgi:hypothetical protein
VIPASLYNASSRGLSVVYGEDTCMSDEEEDTCMSDEEEE